MATPPTIHCLCDDCWRRSAQGQAGQLPKRLHQITLRECCSCGEKTSSGIFIEDDPRLYRCRGVHPMTDEEVQSVLETFLGKALLAMEMQCARHGLSAEHGRRLTATALKAVLDEYRQRHGIVVEKAGTPAPGPLLAAEMARAGEWKLPDGAQPDVVHDCPVCAGAGRLNVAMPAVPIEGGTFQPDGMTTTMCGVCGGTGTVGRAVMARYAAGVATISTDDPPEAA